MKRKVLILAMLLFTVTLSACGETKEICSNAECNEEAYKDGLCPEHYVQQTIAEEMSSLTLVDESKNNEPENDITQLPVNDEPQLSETENNISIQEINIGETIITSQIEFTLNGVEFSHDVMPQNPPSFYTHYPANAGQVYIHIDFDIKNLAKSNLECDEVYGVTADYNQGYTYQGGAIVEDTDGDFTYANITSINPLQTLGVHCLIDCPEEVETSTNPLYLIITLNDGSQYKYTIR